MKKFTSILMAAMFAVSTFAADYSGAVTGGTPLAVLTSGAVIDSITFTATSGSNTTVKAYDSASSTNYVNVAYSRPLVYTTNFTTVFTNLEGYYVTNTFDGIFTTVEAVGASTNERTRVLNRLVIADAQRTFNLNYQSTQGLVILADQDGVVEVTYRTP